MILLRNGLVRFSIYLLIDSEATYLPTPCGSSPQLNHVASFPQRLVKSGNIVHRYTHFNNAFQALTHPRIFVRKLARRKNVFARVPHPGATFKTYNAFFL